MNQIKFKLKAPAFVSEPAENMLKNIEERKFYIHTYGYVEVESEEDFTIPLPDASKTQELWYYSIPSINALLTSNSDHKANYFFERGARILKAFLLWLQTQDKEHPAWKDEHAVANRLQVISYALWKIVNSHLKDKDNLNAIISAAVVQHANWVAADEHYIWNNHGLMMDQALLVASCLPPSKNFKPKYWREVALRRIKLLLNKSFDENGCCTENSPAYHLLNERLFQSVAHFSQQIGAIEVSKEIESRLKDVSSVSGLFVRQDGSYSTVGDSEIEATHWINKAGLSKACGTGIFPGGGFFLHKTESMYLTMKSGGTSYVHRHLDDTSITLFYKGKDIIIDAGLFNFERNTSRFSRWFMSTKAHSGIFVEKSDDTRFANFENPDDLACLHPLDVDDQIGAVAESNLSSLARVNRKIRVVGSKILINDNIISNSIHPVNWRQQFLLAPDVEIIKSSGKSFFAKTGDISFSLIQNNDYAFKVEEAFYSKKFGEKQEIQALVFSGSDPSVSIETVIDLEL